jgi:hypothetical protein
MKHLAIMSEPHFGKRDMFRPGFWFQVSWGEDLSHASLIVLGTREFSQAIEDADIEDMKNLNGHPCQIEVSDTNVVTFVKVLKK